VFKGMTEDWERAFDTFVRAASPGLLRTAVLLTGDRGHAEDVLQTTLVRVAKRFRADDPMPIAYARRVLVNLTRDRHRDRGRRPREVTFDGFDAALPQDAYDAVVVRDSLLAAVRTLPSRQRAVLVLRFFDDRSERETAEMLGCSVGPVKSRTSRALAALRAAGLDVAEREEVRRG